jgi:hypothetical protein
MDLDHFTGTIKFQGAENYQSIWYNVTESWEFFDETSAQYFNIVGYYPLIRACFNNSVGYGATASMQVTDGVVTGLTLTNPGSNYVAAPKVQILGNGSGAEAYATIGVDGQVADLILTNGGSGYLPIQYQSNNFGSVLITTGTITNLQYR